MDGHMEATGSTTADTASNIMLGKATLGDIASRLRAQAAASESTVHASVKRLLNVTETPQSTS